MYRIGILGTENSHAAAFTDILASGAYPDFTLSALFAFEKAPSEAIAAKHPEFGLKICESPEEMLPFVDCVMITARDGKFHSRLALPFLNTGMPAFIDKPFAVTLDDAMAMIDAAKAKKAPVCGGSGLKYSKELLDFKAELEGGAIGKVSSAMLTFAVDLDSVYSGLYFYAGHLAEMLTTVFGNDVRSVRSFVSGRHLMAVARCGELDVVMNFEKKYSAVAYGASGMIVRDITCDNIYAGEFDHFAQMVRSGKQLVKYEDLIVPVRILNAIDRSILTGREETV